jgi:outer membrane protein TolC
MLLHRAPALLLFSMLFTPAAGFALESLNLEHAIQEARERNPEYQRAQAQADEASAQEFNALSGYLPKLTASAMALPAYKFEFFHFPAFGSIEAPSPVVLAALDASINLFDGFRTTNTYRAARLGNEAARHELSRAQLKLDDEVKLRFYRALAAQQLSDVADQNVKTLQDHLAKTKALLTHGASTKLDTLRVEVQLSEALPDQIQAHDNVILARKELARTMGLLGDERPITGTLPTPDARELPNNLSLEISRRDDLQAAQERADAASKLKLASYSGWIPQVNFLAEYQYYNNNLNPGQYGLSVWDSSLFGEAYTVTFSLQWSLFDGGNIARIREAAARQAEAEKTAQIAIDSAPVDFETWKRRFLSNVSLYQARAHAIDSANESVRLARISYEAGVRTSSEVLDAELDLFRARAGVVRAQLDATESWLNLELAVGHPL